MSVCPGPRGTHRAAEADYRAYLSLAIGVQYLKWRVPLPHDSVLP